MRRVDGDSLYDTSVVIEGDEEIVRVVGEELSFDLNTNQDRSTAIEFVAPDGDMADGFVSALDGLPFSAPHQTDGGEPPFILSSAPTELRTRNHIALFIARLCKILGLEADDIQVDVQENDGYHTVRIVPYITPTTAFGLIDGYGDRFDIGDISPSATREHVTGVEND